MAAATAAMAAAAAATASDDGKLRNAHGPKCLKTRSRLLQRERNSKNKKKKYAFIDEKAL